jgi:hypothetical protein
LTVSASSAASLSLRSASITMAFVALLMIHELTEAVRPAKRVIVKGEFIGASFRVSN